MLKGQIIRQLKGKQEQAILIGYDTEDERKLAIMELTLTRNLLYLHDVDVDSDHPWIMGSTVPLTIEQANKVIESTESDLYSDAEREVIWNDKELFEIRIDL